MHTHHIPTAAELAPLSCDMLLGLLQKKSPMFSPGMGEEEHPHPLTWDRTGRRPAAPDTCCRLCTTVRTGSKQSQAQLDAPATARWQSLRESCSRRAENNPGHKLFAETGNVLKHFLCLRFVSLLASGGSCTWPLGHQNLLPQSVSQEMFVWESHPAPQPVRCSAPLSAVSPCSCCRIQNAPGIAISAIATRHDLRGAENLELPYTFPAPTSAQGSAPVNLPLSLLCPTSLWLSAPCPFILPPPHHPLASLPIGLLETAT